MSIEQDAPRGGLRAGLRAVLRAGLREAPGERPHAVLRRSGHATGVLASGLRTSVPALLGLAPLVLVVALIGFLIPWLPRVVRPLRRLADAERHRAGRLLGHEIPTPYGTGGDADAHDGARLVSSPALWRDALWLVLHGLTGLAAALLALGLWLGIPYSLSLPLWWWAAPEGSVSAFWTLQTWPQALTLPLLQTAVYGVALVWLVPALARWQLGLADRLLRPTRRAALSARVEQLAATRADALEAHGAELRRIERDLHDGTQAQLVAAALRLGLAEHRFAEDPDAARALMLEARDGVEQALSELRHVVRGIYPPILADRGLAGAVAALAAGQPIPVATTVDEGRAPAAVEAAAYYVVAEALTNVARHSGAGHASVRIRRVHDRLTVTVHDDGRGGADESAGSGLAGIRRRAAALDGSTRVESPVGAGTTVEVKLRCG